VLQLKLKSRTADCAAKIEICLSPLLLARGTATK
jgi:hypothetical protein